MKIDEREIRQAMDRRMSGLEISAERRARIRGCIRVEEAVVKRKMLASVAIALVLTLLLTSVALAVGVNLFEFFGRNDARLAVVADQAELVTQRSETVETEKLGRSVGTIHNAYYDGQSLIVAYSVENARRVEAYAPTEEMLKHAEMERIEYTPLAKNEEEKRVIGEYVAQKKAGEPCGLAIYSVYVADHSYADGVDLGATTEMENNSTDGMKYVLREYEMLPVEIRNKDSLNLEMPLREHGTCLWFDGKVTWVIREEPKDVGRMSANVERTEVSSLSFSGKGEYEGTAVQAWATLSAVRGEVILNGTGAFPKIEGSHYNLEISDEKGNRYRTSSMTAKYPDEIRVSFYGNGTLPEKLSVVICMEDPYDICPKPVSEPIEMILFE